MSMPVPRTRGNATDRRTIEELPRDRQDDEEHAEGDRRKPTSDRNRRRLGRDRPGDLEDAATDGLGDAALPPPPRLARDRLVGVSSAPSMMSKPSASSSSVIVSGGLVWIVLKRTNV